MRRFEAYQQLRKLCSQNATGKYRFSANNGKKEIDVYIRDGEIYALHNTSEPNILRRLQTAGIIDDEKYAEMITAKPPLPQLINQLPENDISENIINTILTETLLSGIGTVTQWKTATKTFKRNETTEQLTIQPIPFEKIEQAVYHRKLYVDTLWKTMSPKTAMTKCAPTINENYDEPFDTPDTETLFNLIDGRRTIDKLSSISGMTRTETIHTLWMLTQKNAINIENYNPNTEETPSEYKKIEGDIKEIIQLVKQRYHTHYQNEENVENVEDVEDTNIRLMESVERSFNQPVGLNENTTVDNNIFDALQTLQNRIETNNTTLENLQNENREMITIIKNLLNSLN